MPFTLRNAEIITPSIILRSMTRSFSPLNSVVNNSLQQAAGYKSCLILSPHPNPLPRESESVVTLSRATGNYRLYDNGFGKARGRRLYCNTPTTDNAAQNLYLKAYIKLKMSISPLQRFS
jgi:hypothetical protein